MSITASNRPRSGCSDEPCIAARYFTSAGSEANNHALKGVLYLQKVDTVTSAIRVTGT